MRKFPNKKPTRCLVLAEYSWQRKTAVRRIIYFHISEVRGREVKLVQIIVALLWRATWSHYRKTHIICVKRFKRNLRPIFIYFCWICFPCHFTLAVIFPQRSQNHKTGSAFITNTPVITTVWTQCGSTLICLVLRADKKNTMREKLWYSFQLGQFFLAVIYHSHHSFPLYNETWALNLMLYNLVRPPDEPCPKIVKKWMEQKIKCKKKRAHLAHLFHNLSKQLWILKALGPSVY